MAAISGKDVIWVFEEMPLAALFAYEHFYYVKEGYITKPKRWKNTLDDLVKEV